MCDISFFSKVYIINVNTTERTLPIIYKAFSLSFCTGTATAAYIHHIKSGVVINRNK